MPSERQRANGAALAAQGSGEAIDEVYGVFNGAVPKAPPFSRREQISKTISILRYTREVLGDIDNILVSRTQLITRWVGT